VQETTIRKENTAREEEEISELQLKHVLFSDLLYIWLVASLFRKSPFISRVASLFQKSPFISGIREVL
jgi:hypothetical protein